MSETAQTPLSGVTLPLPWEAFVVSLATRRAVIHALLAAAVVAATAEAAPRGQVVLGEVRSDVTARQELEQELRDVLTEELERVDLSRARRQERWILSATLTQLATERRAQGSETSAVLQATLRRQRSGVLHATLTGRAKAVDGGAAREAERAALRGAVRGALRRLPEALR